MPSKKIVKRNWKPEITIAIIGLIGLISAAVIANFDKWFSKPTHGPDAAAVSELISIFNLRASKILESMESAKEETLLSIRSGDTNRSETDFLKEYDAIRKLFLELHEKNIGAIKSSQILASHEIILDINYLLWLRSSDVFRQVSRDGKGRKQGSGFARPGVKYKRRVEDFERSINLYPGSKEMFKRIPEGFSEIWDRLDENRIIDDERLSRIEERIREYK